MNAGGDAGGGSGDGCKVIGVTGAVATGWITGCCEDEAIAGCFEDEAVQLW